MPPSYGLSVSIIDVNAVASVMRTWTQHRRTTSVVQGSVVYGDRPQVIIIENYLSLAYGVAHKRCNNAIHYKVEQCSRDVAHVVAYEVAVSSPST